MSDRAQQDRRSGRTPKDARSMGDQLRALLEDVEPLRAADDDDPMELLLRGLANEALRQGQPEREQFIRIFLDVRKWDLEGRGGKKPWEPSDVMTDLPVSTWSARKRRYEDAVTTAVREAELKLEAWEARDKERDGQK